MKNLNLIRGLFIMAIAAFFGGMSMRYNIGDFSRAGPGLFPLCIAALVFVSGVAMVIRSRFVPPVDFDYNMKNIALVLTGFCGFAAISEHINLILGIVFLVFVTSLAGKRFSAVRCVKISIGLVIVAFGFKYLLGLQLPLY